MDLTMGLNETIQQQNLLTVEPTEQKEVLSDRQIKLKKLYGKVKRAQKAYVMAIKLFQRADSCDHEVLEWLRDEQCEPWFQCGDMCGALERLTDEETGPKFRIDLSEINQPGYIEVARLKGKFNYNRLMSVELVLPKVKK